MKKMPQQDISDKEEEKRASPKGKSIGPFWKVVFG